jgi:hypothetical protein
MNAFDRDMDAPALLHFGDGEFAVMRPGRYVVCAVSGRRVPLDTLRYWSVERQEAYAGAREALERMAPARGPR